MRLSPFDEIHLPSRLVEPMNVHLCAYFLGDAMN